MEHDMRGGVRRRRRGRAPSDRAGRRTDRSGRRERVRLAQLRDGLRALISSDADFREAFQDLGQSMTQEKSLLDQLGDFCVQVFGAVEEVPDQSQPAAVPQLTSLLNQEQQFLSGGPDGKALAGHILRGAVPDTQGEPQPEQEGTAVPSEEAVPAAGTVLFTPDYDGLPLPENYTLDCLSLGELETTTPVLGRLTSPYGYRDHPVNGKYLFHGGVDISGNKGDPIGCFADGTVEFVGENDSYGLYLQVDHGNSVKSFYAHCSAVYVKKGQWVSLGERIAAIGDTGLATASHLHLELRCAGLRLNPGYYVEFLNSQ